MPEISFSELIRLHYGVFLSALLELALLLRLYSEQLHKKLPWFTCLLAADMILSPAILLWQALKFKGYFTVFLAGRSIRWILYFLVVLELYSQILVHHKALAKLGRSAVSTLVGIAALGTLASLFIGTNEVLRNNSPLLVITMKLHVAITGTLMLFVAIVFSILLWFPIQLSRNTIAYCVGFAVYFASKSITVLAMSARGANAVAGLNTVLLLVECGCLLFWAVRLTRTGETTSSASLRNLSPKDKEELLDKLDRFDREIMRTFDRM